MRPSGSLVALTAIALAAAACRDAAPARTQPRRRTVQPIARHIEVDANAPVLQIAAGRDAACALLRDGHIACWGDNAFTSQALMIHGIPPPRRQTPQLVANLEHAVEISMGPGHGCARLADGSVSCWRDRIADSSGSDVSLAAEPEAALAHAVTLASSTSETCVLHGDGSGACSFFRRSRATVNPPSAPAMQIAVGTAHGCEITATRAVQCWGTPLLPALGPVAAGADLPGLAGIDEIVAGDDYNCARSLGTVYCWGANTTGQTGRARGTPGNSAVPYRIPTIADAASLAAGVYHACAVRATGDVTCWGDNRFGQLGATAPMQTVSGLSNVVQVALGEWHSCALTRAGEVQCWGQNQRGQLGDGTLQDRPQPAPVHFSP